MTCFRLVKHVSGLKEESCLGHNTERDCSEKRAVANTEEETAQKLIPQSVVGEAAHCEMLLA